jgi:uncharacterized membrane protein YqaE (UPF0057 family)
MDVAEQDIQEGKYNIVSKFLYGGVFSGAIVIPTNFIKIILSLIFPPLGTILEIVGKYLYNEFPYITWDAIVEIFRFDNMNKIIYTFALTSMFYIPGLIYTLAQITINPNNMHGTLQCDPDTGVCTILNPISTKVAAKA